MLPPIVVVQPSITITNESKLLDVSKHGELLKSWFDGQVLELKKIYSGLGHTFTKASFDQDCLNKGPTLSVV